MKAVRDGQHVLINIQYTETKMPAVYRATSTTLGYPGYYIFNSMGRDILLPEDEATLLGTL